MRVKQRQRNKEAERRGRRYKRQQELARRDGLPETIRAALLMRGLALPAVGSVRGQLLDAILAGTVQKGSAWIFDWSVRDLAAGGLADGKQRDKGYLLGCIQGFIASGIMRNVEGRKGRPVVYEVVVNGAGQTASRDEQ